MKNVLYRFIESSEVERVGMLIAFLLVENNITFLPNVGPLYYLFMLIALLFLLLKQQSSCGSLLMLGLYIACILSIVNNDIPAFFQPWQRFFTFLLITALVSPTIYNETFVRFKTQSFITIVRLLQYVIFASAIYGLMGGGYKFKYFQGITNHSMILGPFAAICTLFCVLQLLAHPDKKKLKIRYGVLLLVALFCLLQAASRTAFLATIVAVMVFLAVYYRNALGRYMKIVIAICVMLFLTFPVWSRYTDKLESKNMGNIAELNINSREEHWEQRWIEFKSSPFIGIGFSVVSTTSRTGSTFSQDGKVETGSSWLSLLSMTGLFGFLAFLAVFVNGLRKAWNLWAETPLLSGFLIAILCFWILHMMAEGYIFAGGNSLAFCVWLTLGTVYGIASNNQIAHELQQKLAE